MSYLPYIIGAIGLLAQPFVYRAGVRAGREAARREFVLGRRP